MNGAPARQRGHVPPWDGERLAAAFAARRDRPWTLGYESVRHPVMKGHVAWEGDFPKELSGTLIRNGPARHEFGGQRYAHRWDGDGMIQRFILSCGGVSHLGRFVRTQKLIDEEAAGRMLYSGFGTPVDHLPPTAERIERSNPANISVVPFDGEYLALWEAGHPYRMDPRTLNTLGRPAWLDANRPTPFSAHPKISTDGTLWNFGVDPVASRLHLYGIRQDGRANWTREIRLDAVAPVHDFAVTERHLVLLMPSLTVDRERLAEGSSFAESCRWTPQLGMRVLVVAKADASVRELRLSPGCLFHVVNAWEDQGGAIHVDYMRSADPSSLLAGWSVMAGDYRHAKGASLTRATLDSQRGTARQETLVDHDAEFPSIAPADVGQQYRQTVCLERSSGRSSDVPGYDTVACIDVKDGGRRAFFFGNDWLVEEHLLVTGADDEMPRWVLGTALDLRRRSTVVGVFRLDALDQGPIAQAVLPYALPLGLHGTFVHSKP